MDIVGMWCFIITCQCDVLELYCVTLYQLLLRDFVGPSIAEIDCICSMAGFIVVEYNRI